MRGVEEEESQEYDVKKTKTRTLLTNKKEAMRTSMKAGVRLEKIPESALSKKAFSVEPVERGYDGGSQGGVTETFVVPVTMKN